jgi:hypothetical protein
MAIYVYPENYVAPPEPEQDTLSAGERATLKTTMQNYIINKDKPILLKELVQTAHEWALNVHNKHLKTADIRAVALEIREEWGYPGQIIEP